MPRKCGRNGRAGGGIHEGSDIVQGHDCEMVECWSLCSLDEHSRRTIYLFSGFPCEKRTQAELCQKVWPAYDASVGELRNGFVRASDERSPVSWKSKTSATVLVRYGGRLNRYRYRTARRGDESERITEPAAQRRMPGCYLITAARAPPTAPEPPPSHRSARRAGPT